MQGERNDRLLRERLGNLFAWVYQLSRAYEYDDFRKQFKESVKSFGDFDLEKPVAVVGK